MLTTTQASALVELQRRGSLRPSSRAWSKYDGSRTFARQTLQALVDNGHAEWRKAVRMTRHIGPVTYDGFITPLESSGEDSVPEPAEERSYCIGLPVAVTLHTDGSITFDVDLSEVDDLDEDVSDRYPEDIVAGDASTVSAAAARIGNHHSFTVTLKA